MNKYIALLGVTAMITLSACGTNSNLGTPSTDNSQGSNTEMNHSSSGDVPKGLQQADNPTYQIGEQAIINTNHMEGMDGATATIVGAYETTAYAVTYTPTTGGSKVTNHKWVIHEEIKNASEQPYQLGDEVVLEADHMAGMKGASATIDSVEQTIVYMVDFTPTTGGDSVKNHKWVTENELSKK